MRGLAAVLLCCLALAACGGSAPSPSQLLSRAEQGFEGVRSYHVSGGLFVNQTRVVISADVLADGDATGTITVMSQTTHFVVAHGVNYFETLETNIIGPVDPTLLSLLAALRANIPWWKASGSPAAAAALSSLAPRAFVSRFLADRTGLSARSHRDDRGRQATLLTSAEGKVFLSTGSAPRLLEVTTAPHYIAGSDVTDVELVADSFNKTVAVAAPDNALPVDDAAALPPFFSAKLQDTKDCDSAGCTVAATVRAVAGHGTATVTLSLLSDSGAVMASCATPATIAAVSQTVDVSCRATGSGWTQFDQSGGGSYKVEATVDNPSYTAAAVLPPY